MVDSDGEKQYEASCDVASWRAALPGRGLAGDTVRPAGCKAIFHDTIRASGSRSARLAHTVAPGNSPASRAASSSTAGRSVA